MNVQGEPQLARNKEAIRETTHDNLQSNKAVNKLSIRAANAVAERPEAENNGRMMSLGFANTLLTTQHLVLMMPHSPNKLFACNGYSL